MNDSKTEATAPPLTIVEFLTARIDEDEERLKWTTDRGPWEAHRNYLTQQRGLVRHEATGDQLAEFTHPADAEHAVYWQPARAHREIAAKWAIIANERRARGAAGAAPIAEQISSSDGPATAYWRGQDWVLKQLASVYAEHPDYREEWAV